MNAPFWFFDYTIIHPTAGTAILMNCPQSIIRSDGVDYPFDRCVIRQELEQAGNFFKVGGSSGRNTGGG